ncbi:MAG: N-acetyltransferase [Candidatus Gracilibacteria bacterium]|nr:N-acetyltransferase [Candidatus Gracilibacteria bacterium]MDD3120016.1 N-acetyltransferase [Candidatus Gracilibacteria bacterium]MDD4529991.1 N-acetyltransferase [Candidatus Gracilibacteria bacterium]
MKEIIFRKIKPKDWQEYKKIRLEALQEEPIAFGASYEEKIIENENNWKISIKKSSIFFALDNDEIIGIMGYWFETNLKTKHIAKIFGVYLKEKYRKKGIGDKFLKFILKQIIQNKEIKKIALAVNTKQKGAIKLYEKNGFEIVGKLKNELFYSGQFYDEFLMEKYL